MGIVAERLWGLAGLAIGMAIDIVIVFVMTASARTWAVLNPDRAAGKLGDERVAGVG